MKSIRSLALSITAFLLLVNLNGYTQPVPFNQHVVDSIISQLPAAKDDSTKVKSLILLAQMYIDKANPKLVLKYTESAESLSRKINYPKGVIGSLSQMAFFYAITGDWPNSIMKINEAIPLCEKENSKMLQKNLKLI